MSPKLTRVVFLVSDLVVCTSLVCYILAFFLPVLRERDEIFYGYAVFIYSIIPGINLLLMSKEIPPIILWIANITWFCGVLYFFKRRNSASFRLAICSVLFASLRLGKPELMVGYYAWVASMCLLFIGTSIR